MEMENSEKDISLREDKALVEALFSKESLMQFNENQQQSNDSFFEQQQASILNAIGQQKARIIIFGKYGKIAVAASILAIIATSYLYIQASKQSTATVEYVKIEEIPSEEIENYVNANELIAEIDWSTEIDEAAEIFDETTININSNKDTNKTE
jgi:hypothetical protein